MNYKKFFELAASKGIEASEITSSKTKTTSVSLFHKEIENFTISDQSDVSARGIYNGKFGKVATERLDNGVFDFLTDGIINQAKLVEKEEMAKLFKGSEKYTKKNVYNKELALISLDDKINALRKLEEAALVANEYVTEVQVSYEEEESESVLCNSYGLNLKSKSNYFYYAVSVICKKGEEIKSDYGIFLDSDFKAFDPEKLAKETAEKVVNKFDGASIEPNEYPCILSPDTVSAFLSSMVNAGVNAENVQKNSSVLVGKLNQKVFSNKVTIKEKPLDKTVFFRYFDDEGVATTNKTIVDKGVLKTYLYNLETADKEGIESTGNGYNAGGGKIGIRAVHLYLEPGKKSEEEIMSGIKKGVYVTGVTGLHSGLNAQSGDFSLAGEGFLIEDGKKTKPLTVITVGGNLYSLFNDVTEVANNKKLGLSSVETPSIRIKGLKISSL